MADYVFNELLDNFTGSLEYDFDFKLKLDIGVGSLHPEPGPLNAAGAPYDL